MVWSNGQDCTFLISVVIIVLPLEKNDLINRLECEYKQGKAYRYFTNKFIGEILFHYVSDESQFCILKTKCVPSQRVLMKQYDVWVICRKNIGDFIEGEILAGYCTCTAGLLGSCNHVAGLLFRVEAAVLTGYCNPTCTSTLATWNIPRGEKEIQPDEVSKFLFRQDTYMKKATQEMLEKWKSKAKVKKEFRVMTDSHFYRLSGRKNVKEECFIEACAIIPPSCFVELMESKQKKYTPS